MIALMLSGGNALERYAARRSRRELTALLARAPHSARLRTADGLVEVAVERVAPGDLLLVRSGEVLPVDGIVESADAVLDESALTGEPLPRAVSRGDAVRSGATNAGDALDLRATRPAAESAYAAIVRLVQEAGARRAPFVRMADRYAVIFLAVTLALAGSRGPRPATPSAPWPCSSWRPRARSSWRPPWRWSRASRGPPDAGSS